MFSISVATNTAEKRLFCCLQRMYDWMVTKMHFCVKSYRKRLFLSFLFLPQTNIMSTQLNKIMETNNVLFFKCFVYLTFSMNKSEIYLWYILYCSKLHINKNDNDVYLTHMKICMLQLPK